ncbi:MAG: hypothetical protein KIH89_002205 [Candidatus Shapirobacteria bacterium]|nr:hypothetical protein [Candidatus Shapirobacteria bacterium]
MENQENQNLLQPENENLATEIKVPPITDQSSNKKLKIVIWLLIALLLITVTIVIYLIFKTKKPTLNNELKTSNTEQVTPTAVSASKEHLPVIVYTQKINTIKTTDRLWDVVQIYKKTGTNPPELLAEVGKVGEMPTNFKISPDKKSLIINLESKLQILNLSTKELKDLYIPDNKWSSFSFSPDSNKLFIIDQYYPPTSTNQKYYIRTLNISDQSIQTIKEDTSDSIFSPLVWRNDNKVLVEEPRGDFSEFLYFDLDSKKLSKVPNSDIVGPVSESGYIMAIPNGNVGNICNEFSGSTTSKYKIIEPVSGKILREIGDSNLMTSIIAFSPDDKEVIYSAEKAWINKNDCDKNPEKIYYKAEISSGKIEKISNPNEVINNWSNNYLYATHIYSQSSPNTNHILINDQPIITSDKELYLIDGFYN